MRRIFVLALSLWTLAATGQTPRPMTLVDFMNLPQVLDPQLSPDQRTVLYIRSEPDWKANKRIGHIWKINADGSGAIQLTTSPDGESSPRWSPDGKTIAFLSKRGANEFNQIYLLAAAGGEAHGLTNHATAVTNITWSSDGSAIYFRSADPKSDQLKAKEKLRDDVFMYDENYQQQHLWSVNVANSAEHRLTSGDYSVMAYQVSRDGKKIAFHRAPTPLFEDTALSEVWTMDASGSNPKQITHNKVEERGAELSPDGSTVLFTSGANQKFETYYNGKIFTAAVQGGEPKLLSADFPYEVERATWSKDGKSIYFLANMGVHSELFQMSPNGGKPEQLTNGKHAINAWTMSSNEHIFTTHEMSAPAEVYVLENGSPRKVTSVFAKLASEYKMPRQESIQWKGADGATVEGLLAYPLDYVEGQKYPLAVQTHGGPQASDKFGLGGGQNYVPVLAAKGYFVLQPNYRGSTGYGDAFMRDMVGHYFQNAHLDVLAGVDYLIAKGMIDPDRMVKMGWSGGGHMTNKIITTTGRFKAASAGAGAANWISMYAQSDTRVYRTPWFGGTPWQKDAPIAAYWDNSPLKDVSKVTTPTIFLVGQNDARVPEPQSIEMFHALRSNGVETHLYVAPREPHGWEELRHVLFKMNIELEWFEKHVTKHPYAWEQAPASSTAP